MNNPTTEAPAPAPGAPGLPVSVPELIRSLEQATMVAKELQSIKGHNHLIQIYSSLYHAQNQLASFFASQTHLLPHFRSPALPATENTLSSATTADGDELMQVGDDEDDVGASCGAEENSKSSIDGVEEKMRDCFIKNKRPKRRLSPAAEEGRVVGDDYGYAGGVEGFDPQWTKSRALDLIYQFHG
ncbi:hypothetical protein Tsubulata_042208 [Turnera subulata]|uniref:Uncharacterized protein n=1 Tax=Turnera subulata TaxID=218843 RepID=A0A9Q0FL09_9ROSI|nr:hypothetical protein Tsubulata_042208 [Turnera subulata]